MASVVFNMSVLIAHLGRREGAPSKEECVKRDRKNCIGHLEVDLEWMT